MTKATIATTATTTATTLKTKSNNHNNCQQQQISKSNSRSSVITTATAIAKIKTQPSRPTQPHTIICLTFFQFSPLNMWSDSENIHAYIYFFLSDVADPINNTPEQLFSGWHVSSYEQCFEKIKWMFYRTNLCYHS